MCIYKRASCPGCNKDLKGHHTFEKCAARVCQGEKTVAIKLRLRDITRAGHQWECPHAGCIFNLATEELLTDWEEAQSDPQSDLGPKFDALFTGLSPMYVNHRFFFMAYLTHSPRTMPLKELC